MHEMLTFDLASVDLRTIPQTAALADQKMLALKAEEQWWLDMLMSGHPSYISWQELKKIDWQWENATKIGGFQNEVQHLVRDWSDGLFYG
jgi:hypothetical protein